jgi:phosphatidylserine/phosphatidylglycerophosphate/cardiolipin synthase-like enzyme
MKVSPCLKIVVVAVLATTLSSSLSAIAAPSVQVGFSPEGTARELVLSTIHHARESVRMMGYNFTAADIAKALASASRRGVDVKVILDNRENQNKYSKAALNILVNAGVNVRLTDAYKIHHDKVISSTRTRLKPAHSTSLKQRSIRIQKMRWF